jgi:hypothetical protein
MRQDSQGHWHLLAWRIWMGVLGTILFGVISMGVVVINNNQRDLKEIAKRAERVSVEQDRFRDNFSNYMSCLIVNDQNLLAQVGEKTYVEICKQLLYRGIDPIPPTIEPDLSVLQGPPVSTTTTTTEQ